MRFRHQTTQLLRLSNNKAAMKTVYLETKTMASVIAERPEHEFGTHEVPANCLAERRRPTFTLIVTTAVPVVLDSLALPTQAARGPENTRR